MNTNIIKLVQAHRAALRTFYSVGCAAVVLTGCGALDVNAPTTLRVESLNNAVGATLSVSGVQKSISDAVWISLPEAGALSDEAVSALSGGLNRRRDDEYLTLLMTEKKGQGAYSAWQTAWQTATVALPRVRQYSSTGPRGREVAEVLAYRGFAMLNLAEQICPGFPVADVNVNGEAITPKFTSLPLSTDSAFKHALLDLDTAVVYAGDTGRVSHLAKIWKARALVGLGRAAEAAATVADVPTDFVDTVHVFGMQSRFRSQYTVKNRKGQNGLDYVSANDPRVHLQDKFGDGRIFILLPYVQQGFYGHISVATGIEARLIEAESQVATAESDPAWLTTLNVLRQTAGLSDTTDPGTTESRVNLIFRERAFWLFATGHRLGDMRRLVARYGRDAESVFPHGDIEGSVDVPIPQYGTATSIPFDGAFEHLTNPNISGCM